VGGKLFAGSTLARLKADEAGVLLEGTRWQVRANVTSVYASVQALTAVAAAYEENLASLEKARDRLQIMVQEGKRPEVDFLKASETLEEARAQLADAQADLTHVKALLAALLDYPADQELELDPLPDQIPVLPADSAEWSGMVEKASAVAAAELRVREAEEGKRIARSEFLPKVSVGGNVMEHTASSVTRTQQTWELSLRASIPVFTGGRRTAAYQSAAAAQRAADLALRQTQLQQAAEIRGAMARFEAAKTALEAARRRVEAADEAARIEGLRYDNGASTIEDFLRARTRAAAAEASLAKSEGDVLTAAARINALAEEEIVR
jgi:outer membrane protein TolC